MVIAKATEKGQVVIPAALRKSTISKREPK